MNKTLISTEELKQIALREIHTYPGCEDVSAVGIYPVTDEVVESNWSAQVSSRIQSVDRLSHSCRHRAPKNGKCRRRRIGSRKNSAKQNCSSKRTVRFH